MFLCRYSKIDRKDTTKIRYTQIFLCFLSKIVENYSKISFLLVNHTAKQIVPFRAKHTAKQIVPFRAKNYQQLPTILTTKHSRSE